MNGQDSSREIEIESVERISKDLTNFHEGDSLLQNPAVIYLVSLGSKSSRATMSSFLNIIAKMIGFNSLHDCNWASIKRHHVQMIIEMLKNSNKSPATINTYLSALKGVALEAWSLQQIDSDTLQRIKAVKSVKGSRIPKGRALQENEIRALMESCTGDKSAKGARDTALISVLIGCGLRRSEIVSIDIEHIITQEKAFKVMGKGNKERYAFMPDSVWNNVLSWIDNYRGEGSGPLFQRIRKNEDITNGRLTSQAILYILEQRRIKSGIAKCAPHDLRRTFATILINDGEDIMTVKDSLGHADISTTQKYIKQGHDKMKKAAERFSGL